MEEDKSANPEEAKELLIKMKKISDLISDVKLNF